MRVPGVERVEAVGEGYTVLLVEGTDPAGAIARLAAAVPPARVELARLRLEDVFIRIVSEGAAGSDAARALRAGLQAAGTGGSVRMKRVWLVAQREFLAAVAEQGVRHRLAGHAGDRRRAGHGHARA